MTSSEPVDWAGELTLQLEWPGEAAARPRREGLTDAEYFWEPVPGCWNVRPRGQGVAEEVGGGDFVIDFALPEPQPAPVTTIAWRLGHLLVGVLGDRNATYFGGPPVSYDSYAYPGTAAAALASLDEMYERWIGGVAALSPAALAERCREPGFESSSVAALVLHIHRELIHHLAEVALLRDLWAHLPPADAVRQEERGLSWG
jgi:hypothetical protein